MNEKPKSGKEPWIDPDDSPEWTQADFDHGAIYHGGKLIRPGRPKKGDSKEMAALRIDPEAAIRGRPRIANPKQLTTLRLDPAVLRGFRAMGKGWQTKMNDVLRAYLQRPRVGHALATGTTKRKKQKPLRRRVGR